MKTIKRMVSLVLAMVIAVSMTACSLKNGGGASGKSVNNVSVDEADLVVTYYSGAYGDDWLVKAAEEFRKETGKAVALVPSSDQSCGAVNSLKSGKNLSDIYIGSFAQWPSWVQSGYIENLKSVYDSEVETSKGKVKISDYIDKDMVSHFYLERQYGTGDYYPWAVPWSAMPMSLAYNNDVLKKITHVSSGKVSTDSVDASTNKWIAPPKNLSEWLALCDDINAYKSDDGHKYVPIGWTAAAGEQIYYFMFAWWAQYQGLYKSNVAGQGSFYDFWNFGNTSTQTSNQTFSASVYDQKGLVVTIDNIRKLLVDTQKQEYKNCLSAVNTLSTKELSRAFYAAHKENKERPVITMSSSFGENEARLGGYWDSDSDGKRDTDARFMNIPALDGHESEKYLYCPNSDSMFIPYNAAHKDVAKEFLIFLCSEDQMKKFTIRSKGGLRPFNYDAREITDESISDYTKSVFDVYYNSTRIYDFPMNAYHDFTSGTANSGQPTMSLIYANEHPTCYAGVNIVNAMKKQDGASIMAEVKKNFNMTKDSLATKFSMTEVK